MISDFYLVSDFLFYNWFDSLFYSIYYFSEIISYLNLSISYLSILSFSICSSIYYFSEIINNLNLSISCLSILSFSICSSIYYFSEIISNLNLSVSYLSILSFSISSSCNFLYWINKFWWSVSAYFFNLIYSKCSSSILILYYLIKSCSSS